MRGVRPRFKLRTRSYLDSGLYEEAKQLNIDGRSSMNKDQLERAVDRKKS